jgi:hypothetical protein
MYEGQFVEGMQNGYGLFISVEEGWRYYGEWKKGQIHGKGICTWLDGTTYDGEWVNWNKCGIGQLTFCDGTKCKGEFINVYS